MINRPNTLLRVAVPIIILGMMVGLFFVLILGPGAQPQNQQTNQQAAQQQDGEAEDAAQDEPQPQRPDDHEDPAPPADDADAPPQDQPGDAGEASEDESSADENDAGELPDPNQPATPLVGLRAREAPVPDSAPTPLGSIDGADDSLLHIDFTWAGAGIERLTLTDEFTSIERTENVVIQKRLPPPNMLEGGLIPMSLLAVSIDGALVPLVGAEGQTPWIERSPGVFRAFIEDESGTPVVEIERAFELTPGSHDLILRQTVRNRSDAARSVQLIMTGPADMTPEPGQIGIMQDKRRVRFGYTIGSSTLVRSERFLEHRNEALKVRNPEITPTGIKWPPRNLWPNAESTNKELRLAWAGMSNRYFAVLLHPLRDAGAAGPQFDIVERIDRVAHGPDPVLIDGKIDKERELVDMAMRVFTAPLTVAAGAEGDASMGVYAGPVSKISIRDDARADALQASGIDAVVVFSFGGPCAICTSQDIVGLLSGVLTIVHDYLVLDWALAIILLVVAVRTVLHPITRYSQMSLQRFSKQMQRIAPKQKEIQQKYKDDRKKMQEEMMRLMREENINYAGALGCLPMFLQTPIWIALYAMLFFYFDLRHEAGFFGVFQLATPNWAFLSDLAMPDRFIPLGFGLNIPLLNIFMGTVSSINILPIILGVVFYIHQKYMSPQQALTPEQQSQQRLMRWIMVIGMPLFMYNMPAGLTIYFITNSVLAIFESKHIRARVDKLDERREAEEAANKGKKPARKAKQPKPGGFMARVQQRLEEKQREIEKTKAAQQRQANKQRNRRR